MEGAAAYGGGGGRIAVIASTASFSGTIRANGGGSGATSGAAGTVFIKTPGTNGTLIVDNNNIATFGVYTILNSADYTGVFDQIQLNHAGSSQMVYPSTVIVTASNLFGDGTTGYLRVDGRLDMPATYTMSGYGLILSSMTNLTTLTNLTVGGSSGAVITHEYNGSSEVHKASMTLTNLTIASNGLIDVTGRGYSAGQGPGKPTSGAAEAATAEKAV